jgi:hypothetical protein
VEKKYYIFNFFKPAYDDLLTHMTTSLSYWAVELARFGATRMRHYKNKKGAIWERDLKVPYHQMIDLVICLNPKSMGAHSELA